MARHHLHNLSVYPYFHQRVFALSRPSHILSVSSAVVGTPCTEVGHMDTPECAGVDDSGRVNIIVIQEGDSHRPLFGINIYKPVHINRSIRYIA